MPFVSRGLVMTKDELAHIGEGAVGYLRKITGGEMSAAFPGIPGLEPNVELWALFAANGQPLLVTDELSSALAGAQENELVPVAIH